MRILSLILRRVCVVALAVILAACRTDPHDTSAVVTIRLIVRDGWIREPGSECAGSRPFLYVHNTAPFSILDSRSGIVLASGTLPAGVADRVVTTRLNVPREPTFCRFEFTVRLPDAPAYRLVFGRGDPVEFEAADVDRLNASVSLFIP